MVRQVVSSLISDPKGIYVDGTAGSGGHSEAVAKSLAEEGRLLCLDRDPEGIRMVQERLAIMGDRVRVRKANYAALDRVLDQEGYQGVHGILLDLGMSSFQVDHSGRGFSFSRDEPLDMRMDPELKETASQLVNTLHRRALEDILREYGEERKARLIAKKIEMARKDGAIDTTLQLRKLIQSVVPPSRRRGGIHPATRTFQALRIAVNKELDHLKAFLELVPSLLWRGGRLVVLSYHSLEDRIVKQTMQDWERGCTCPQDLPVCGCGKTPLFRRQLRRGRKPDKEEIADNPRARSAIMRMAERV
jgi:16S rRNA (cytosine1402-N4)-methyltransferase